MPFLHSSHSASASVQTNGVTRRQALELGLGAIGAVAVLTRGVRLEAVPAPALLQRGGSAQGVVFPKGAVIRTLLKDLPPDELAGGATLFHEHMSLATDFNQRFFAANAAVRAANGEPAANRGGAHRDARILARDA